MDLYASFRGKNNGDLSLTWRMAKARGWKSPDTLDRAMKELLARGMIYRTRQGGRNRCNLYAVTWKKTDECGGKLDVPPTRRPVGYWKQGCPPEDLPPNVAAFPIKQAK